MVSATDVVIATQIITETLPISSSSHVWLAQNIWELFHSVTLTPPSEFFMDLLNIPTILVITFFFRRPVFKVFSRVFKLARKLRFSREEWHWASLWMKIVGYVIVANLVTLAMYFTFKHFGGNIYTASSTTAVPRIFGWTITGLLLLSLWLIRNNYKQTEFSSTKAVLVGLAQGICLLPGISRLGTTFVASRWLGLSPRRAIEYSLLLQGGLLIGNLLKGLRPETLAAEASKFASWHTFIIMALATAISYAGLRLVVKLAIARKLWPAGFYLILPIVVTVLFSIF
ncbi:undecaprenyl-diphosphate phosphatase [bacterium]|nr:undecaprenyl-diphosphate phosphatase [bacterium]